MHLSYCHAQQQPGLAAELLPTKQNLVLGHRQYCVLAEAVHKGLQVAFHESSNCLLNGCQGHRWV